MRDGLVVGCGAIAPLTSTRNAMDATTCTAALTGQLRILNSVLHSTTLLFQGVCGGMQLQLATPGTGTVDVPTGSVWLDSSGHTELDNALEGMAACRDQLAILDLHLAAIKSCHTAARNSAGLEPGAVQIPAEGIPGPTLPSSDVSQPEFTPELMGCTTIVQKIGRGKEAAPTNKKRKKGGWLNGDAKVACSGSDERLVTHQRDNWDNRRSWRWAFSPPRRPT